MFDDLEKSLIDLKCFSFLLIKDNKRIYEYGDTTDLFNIASIRKSLISLLFGIYKNKGSIDIGKSLKDLNIDDMDPSLSDIEKSATIKDLLQMRSGIYHEANFETQSAKDSKPIRGSHKPGEYYYYNNWDSNTLGTIFTQLTGKDVFKTFKEEIADKIGMDDFDTSQCVYLSPDAKSFHRAYKFKLSVNDLSKLGLLLLNGGLWNGAQIISTEWLNESLQTYSIDEEGKGIGYLWDIEVNGKLWGNYKYPHGSFGFSGFPGHFLLIMPSLNTVIVYEHTIGNKEIPVVTSNEFGDIVKICVDKLS